MDFNKITRGNQVCLELDMFRMSHFVFCLDLAPEQARAVPNAYPSYLCLVWHELRLACSIQPSIAHKSYEIYELQASLKLPLAPSGAKVCHGEIWWDEAMKAGCAHNLRGIIANHWVSVCINNKRNVAPLNQLKHQVLCIETSSVSELSEEHVLCQSSVCDSFFYSCGSWHQTGPCED
jgi:hypothetical protein